MVKNEQNISFLAYSRAGETLYEILYGIMSLWKSASGDQPRPFSDPYLALMQVSDGELSRWVSCIDGVEL